MFSKMETRYTFETIPAEQLKVGDKIIIETELENGTDCKVFSVQKINRKTIRVEHLTDDGYSIYTGSVESSFRGDTPEPILMKACSKYHKFIDVKDDYKAFVDEYRREMAECVERHAARRAERATREQSTT
jgi:hypothetical protein